MSAGRLDFPALLTLLSEWPNEPVPDQPQTESVMERVRQVLHRLRSGGPRCEADLPPLLRQILLRRSAHTGDAPWIRVPVAQGWPSGSEWRDAQFDVMDDHSSLQIRPRFPRLRFLDGQADLLDDALRELPSRPDCHVPGDPPFVRNLLLPTYTGYGQREAVRALLHLPQTDTLIVDLPTGSGKSVMAHLPPLMGREGVLTLAIVPTVALAIDQASRMRRMLAARYPHREMPPLAYHGGLKAEERKAIRHAIRSGAQPVLFTSPEVATGSLRDLLEDAAGAGRLDHVVIDEAHLVIGWGNGFRPAFQLLPALASSLKQRAAGKPVRIVLASATLTAATMQALRYLFGPPERTYVVAAVHLRPEPRYAFQLCDGAQTQVDRVLEAVRLAPRPFILYVTRPDEATEWLRKLREEGFRRVAEFTGRTPSSQREILLNDWAANRLDGMVATSAFGLGVDKTDVRTVIHATMPESLDRFYQEVGRAGRDGNAGASLLLFTQQDSEQARGIAGATLISDDSGYERWSLMVDHAVPDSTRPDVHWVDISLLPSHLRIESDASAAWNVRTLTLMARAGLIQLISLKGETADDAETPVDFGAATMVAVRILEEGHRDPALFARRMKRARDEIWGASERGLNAMEAVANTHVEVSAALTETYSSTGSIWAPVTSCCGGCPSHWLVREQSRVHDSPRPSRLSRFAARPLDAFWRFGFPKAASNLLVVDVPSDGRYDAVCAALAAALVDHVSPHTFVVEAEYAKSFRAKLEVGINEAKTNAFIDHAPIDSFDEWRGSEGEVRVLFLGRAGAVVPDSLWLSASQLDVLVMPSNVPQPFHPGRLFVDTVPHVHASDLLERLTA